MRTTISFNLTTGKVGARFKLFDVGGEISATPFGGSTQSIGFFFEQTMSDNKSNAGVFHSQTDVWKQTDMTLGSMGGGYSETRTTTEEASIKNGVTKDAPTSYSSESHGKLYGIVNVDPEEGSEYKQVEHSIGVNAFLIGVEINITTTSKEEDIVEQDELKITKEKEPIEYSDLARNGEISIHR